MAGCWFYFFIRLLFANNSYWAASAAQDNNKTTVSQCSMKITKCSGILIAIAVRGEKTLGSLSGLAL